MDLAIVIPVYNEENTIQELVEDFFKILLELRINYTFIIVNDGSTDASAKKLKALVERIPNIQLFNEKNSGHGPSLLKGYQAALHYNWVFQFDSDYQYTLSAFQELWAKRDYYDLLIAEREERSASIARRWITLVLQTVVTLLYGKGVTDINAPYRLMRTTQLKAALPTIHSNSFAPNTLLTAFFIKRRLRIFSTYSVLKHGSIIKKSKLSIAIVKGCVQSIFDLMIFRFKI
jgi:dolichol-phosphate mannosyltransferase